MSQWVFDIIEEIQASNDLFEVKRVLVKMREHLGFSNVAYAIKTPVTFTRSSVLFVSDYSAEWIERYGQQGYVNLDPVALHCFNSQIPYHWKNANEGLKGDIYQFFGEAGEYNLCDGISIGMPHFDGKISLISVASDKSLVQNSAQQRLAEISLNALHPFMSERIGQLVKEPQHADSIILLTEREKTCLVWVAEGKTAHDIATILSISEATVVFHIKNSIHKLNVTNRSQAIAKAVLLGLIAPQFSSNAVPTYHF